MHLLPQEQLHDRILQVRRGGGWQVSTPSGQRLTKRSTWSRIRLGKVKAQGFGPKSVHRLVLPFTMFLELRNIGGNVLLAYHEEFVHIPMEAHQNATYRHLAGKPPAEFRQALAWRPGCAAGGPRRTGQQACRRVLHRQLSRLYRSSAGPEGVARP